MWKVWLLWLKSVLWYPAESALIRSFPLATRPLLFLFQLDIFSGLINVGVNKVKCLNSIELFATNSPVHRHVTVDVCKLFIQCWFNSQSSHSSLHVVARSHSHILKHAARSTPAWTTQSERHVPRQPEPHNPNLFFISSSLTNHWYFLWYSHCSRRQWG